MPQSIIITKTLERVLSKSGLGSRSQARSWIHARRVKVNGRIVENPDHWVNLNSDKILFDDKPLAVAEKRYILLYKPTGYITTYGDPRSTTSSRTSAHGSPPSAASISTPAASSFSPTTTPSPSA